jgi:hypothetical protein
MGHPQFRLLSENPTTKGGPARPTTTSAAAIEDEVAEILGDQFAGICKSTDGPAKRNPVSFNRE